MCLCAQVKRRRHLPPVDFNPRDALPPCVPQGERWQQCIANRTFKSKVIQLVIDQLTGSMIELGEGQSLIIDYQGHPTRYLRGGESMTMSGFKPLGEADVKFTRYADMFDKLQVCLSYGSLCACARAWPTERFFFVFRSTPWTETASRSRCCTWSAGAQGGSAS